MEKDNGKVKVEKRFTALEINQTHIISQVDDIKDQVNNHIPTQISDFRDHINSDIDKLNKRLWIFISTFALSLLSLLLAIVFG